MDWPHALLRSYLISNVLIFQVVQSSLAEQGFERQGLEDKFKKVADRLKVKKQDCNQLLEENQAGIVNCLQ